MFIRLALAWSVSTTQAPILFLPAVLNTSFGQTGDLSAFLANISFLLLFGAMFSYWVNLVFSSPGPWPGPWPKKVEFSQVKANTSIGSRSREEQTHYSVAAQSTVEIPLYNSDNLNPVGVQNMTEQKTAGFTKSLANLSVSSIANQLILFANISLFLLLSIRWQESGHFPLSNLYESLIFLSWSCTTVQLFLIWYYLPDNLNRNIVQIPNIVISELLGSVLAPCALFLNAFATFSLPKEMQQAGPLVPALQSNWLMMHVTVMIISYAALMVGSLLSIAYLILSRVRSGSEKVFKNTSATGMITPVLKESPFNGDPGWSKLFSTISENLDYLSYRIIGIGFPFLTIGILSGAVWANEAWGSYWSWDPKETWALLTWFVFAIYLHTRLTKGWEGERPAVLASFGFIVVWICYLGVNLLGEGLHSYGFLKG